MTLPETNAEGFLCDHRQWNEAVAKQLADKEGVSLTDTHWCILRFLRQFYEDYHNTPPIRAMVKVLAERSSISLQPVNSSLLYQLFPKGPLKQASKIAGLPKPARCT